MVHTRYLRITFTRRDEPWPTDTTAAFEWPVFVKHMRIGRNITGYLDTVGPLLTQDTPLDLTPVTLESIDNISTREVRQRFIIPEEAVRAGVYPNMLGFGVLIQTVQSDTPFDQSNLDNEVSFAWSIYNVTDAAAPMLILRGVETGAVAPGQSWLDWYVDDADAIQGAADQIYELRVSSLNPSASQTVFTHVPNILSSKAVPGTVSFTNDSSSVSTSVDTSGVVSVGDYIVRSDIPEQTFVVNAVSNVAITLNTTYPGATAAGVTANIVYPFTSFDDTSGTYVLDGGENLVMRAWGDVADEGRDVLGNAYRYVTRKQKASFVADPNAVGWMSDPAPSPDAVEALYFDVRGFDTDENLFITSVIEAIQIAPRTPGVRMNIYYSQQGLQGDRPTNTTDWDYLLWTPIHETYTLRRNEVIPLPHSVRAAFIKLEFTALNPLPYRLPTYPPLPAKLFRRFPTWVEDQFNNAQVRNVIEDWFLRSATPVETNILATMSDPILEFEYKQREFLAALALGKISDSQIVNSGIVDVADKAIIDPTTASKIFVSFDNQFQNTLLLNVDQESVLGQAVVARFDPSTITDQNERRARSLVTGDVPFVSTTNNRVGEAYQNLAQIPMRFNKTARHVYTQEQGEFNKKAFFVGIESVRFLRNNYAIRHDDALIVDNLYDDDLLLENTFLREGDSSIEDGQTVYVTYSVNPDTVDEPVILSGTTPMQLGTAGGPAFNVVVFSMTNKQGVQYFQDIDYELSYGTNATGERVTFIQRSSLTSRLGVPPQAIVNVDAATVTGRAVIPSPPTDDAAVVTGVAVISTFFEGAPVPTYGLGHYGTGKYADLEGVYTDAATVIGFAVISGVDQFIATDSATVVGTAVISAAESKIP
jgi:hypothetical protein